MKNYLPAFFALTMLGSCGDSKESKTQILTNNEPTTSADTSVSRPAPIIEITKLVGRPLKEVEKLLGKPNELKKPDPREVPCEDNRCNEASFQDGKYEVVFIHGKADWITINRVSNSLLDEGVITLLGLPESSPAFNNPSNVLRWENVAGIKEISFFSDGSGGIEYIYVKAQTD